MTSNDITKKIDNERRKHLQRAKVQSKMSDGSTRKLSMIIAFDTTFVFACFLVILQK